MERSKLMLTTALVVALSTGAWVTGVVPGADLAAMAESHSGGGEGKGGDNAGGAGGQSGQDNQGGGKGQGGPGTDSDGQGPQAGTPPGTAGGAPAWAQEGIPEVELGRLSVARSPDSVLARAYAESLPTLAAAADFYNLSYDEILDALANDWDSLTIVDSPLANLALLEDAMDGSINLSAVGITNDAATLSAVFLGVATDKTLPITEDTVKALSVIFDVPLTDAQITALADAAEEVRQAVVEGHG